MTREGSIVVEILPSGNLKISVVHSTNESITIQRADVCDLLAALNAELKKAVKS